MINSINLQVGNKFNQQVDGELLVGHLDGLGLKLKV